MPFQYALTRKYSHPYEKNTYYYEKKFSLR